MACSRHRMAATWRGHCAACLLEDALVTPMPGSISDIGTGGTDQPGARRLTIHVPLGASDLASVFLVREEGTSRLLRLKTWQTAAPADFVMRFEHLRSRLADLAER